MPGAQDKSSFSNCDVIQIKHADLELAIDFAQRTVAGVAALTCVAEVEGVTQLVLDTRDLTIKSVKCAGKDAAFVLADAHEALGTKLSLPLPAGAAGQSVVVAIDFATSPESSALQFLEPPQTAGGKHPYMYSQCQAIHCRSLIPCQDTPQVKMTYSARVTVPKPLTALMSAVIANDGKPVSEDGDTQTFSFEQKVPIPSYLFAIAAGELESREIGPRSRVWSEPAMVEAGAYEFGETEAYVKAAEDLAGPYIWGRYDILLLPPSFAYGGMENPCLTFATPTLLAGDRSLTSVIAHEVAHSWTGNFVTNATWEHFWLNEGCNVFLERKILERLHGEPMFNLHAQQGKGELTRTCERIGQEHNFTRLCPDLSDGTDPDDAFSSIPYEKGFYFNMYLEGLCGGADKYMPWFKDSWIQGHKDKTVTSEDFKQCFCEAFPEAGAKVEWDTWLNAPGFPKCDVTYSDTLGKAARALAKAWQEAGETSDFGSPSDIEGWQSTVLELFLDELLLNQLPTKTAQRLGDVYGLTKTRNSEIRFRWLCIGLDAKNAAVLPGIAAFVSEQGRMKFVRPLYRALYDSDVPGAKDLATSTFTKVRTSYAPVARKMLESDLGFRAGGAAGVFTG